MPTILFDLALMVNPPFFSRKLPISQVIFIKITVETSIKNFKGQEKLVVFGVSKLLRLIKWRVNAPNSFCKAKQELLCNQNLKVQVPLFL